MTLPSRVILLTNRLNRRAVVWLLAHSSDGSSYLKAASTTGYALSVHVDLQRLEGSSVKHSRYVANQGG